MAKILLVKRRPDDIDWLTKILSEKGYEVVSTQTASQAMEILRKEEKVNLIICGKILGDMHVEDLLTRLKRSKEFSNIPLIVSSGMFTRMYRGQEEIRAGAFAAFNEVDNKPEELLKLVEEALKLQKGG